MISIKLFQKTPTAAKALLISVMLGACQNEKDVAVSPVTEQIQPNYANAKISADSRLIKDGFATFKYAGPRSLLSKETQNEAAYYKVYTYSGNTILAIKLDLVTNDILPGTDKYILNSDGLCVESTFNNRTTIYEYADGYLRKTYNKANPNQRQEFTYQLGPDGISQNLIKITNYNQNNVQASETNYTYFVNGQGVVDLHPIYPDHFGSVSCRYLPIFGKYNTHLVRTTIEKVKNPNVELKYLREYTYYPDGRVKTEKVSDLDKGIFFFANAKQYSSPMSGN